jgi:hypothetical protein
MDRGCMKDNIWLSIQIGLGLDWPNFIRPIEKKYIYEKIKRYFVLFISLKPRLELANQDPATDRYHS